MPAVFERNNNNNDGLPYNAYACQFPMILIKYQLFYN